MTPYSGQPLTAPVDATVLVLVARARDGNLVFCAGAGLSMAADASLPSGPALGQLLHERCEQRLGGYVAPADTENLIDVADAAAAVMGTLLPLQYEVLEVADFLGATPSFGHRVIALLLAEGAVSSVLLWNWDDCIERSAPEGERIQVARTLEDVQQLRVPSVAKIHGCATRVTTLMITSEQLTNPPLWADATFNAKLRTATAVFIGVGDVADYARRRIVELAGDIPELDVYLVSPRMGTHWSESIWAELLPALGNERRIAKTADEFLDELSRAWAVALVDRLRELVAPLTGAASDGTNRVIEAMNQMTGAELIWWCRAAAFRSRFGRSVIRCSEAQQAAIALGVLVGQDPAPVMFLADGRWRLGEANYEILIACESANATDIHSEAHRRAERLAGRRLVEDSATFVVSGTVVGPLAQPEAPDLVEGEVDSLDVLSGPRGIRIQLISASELSAQAA